MRVVLLRLALLSACLPVPALAQEQRLPTVEVQSAADAQIGIAESASQGTVTQRELENRPRSRSGEMLEAVPGMVVTQHSGDGKANQYFARGFNLDHGTDFRTTVLGMPVNMPSHAHGQGYTDLNFIIPELVSGIRYKKGNYYAEEGDFSSAGAAAFDYVRSLERGLLSLEVGSHRYGRSVLANSHALDSGTLLYALEAAGYDGPWQVPEDYRRYNGYLSWSFKRGNDALRVAAMMLDSSWRATDQLPQRAINAGLVGRFGSLDASDGGSTARQSLSADFSRSYANGVLRANAYLVRSRLELFSNFTYFLSDPVNGDQFRQSERRLLGGLNLERALIHRLGRFESETTVGVQTRQDRLRPVALASTVQRTLLSTTGEDDVTQTSAGVFIANTTRLSERWRTVVGVRRDQVRFDVASRVGAAGDGGVRNAGITSPKLSLIFSPARGAELYANWGQGFHSNDARGVTAALSPSTALVKSTGRELGLRADGWLPGLQTTLALWELDLASELVFVGDAGTTEASRPSRRRGIELGNVYKPRPWLQLDLELAWSRARFADDDPLGPHIPGSVQRVGSFNVTARRGRASGAVRVRYVGPRALVEDGSVRSSSSTLINTRFAYALTPKVKLTAEVINLLNRSVSDIDYFYASQLRTEVAPVDDIHTHPAEPRSLRLGLVLNW